MRNGRRAGRRTGVGGRPGRLRRNWAQVVTVNHYRRIVDAAGDARTGPGNRDVIQPCAFFVESFDGQPRAGSQVDQTRLLVAVQIPLVVIRPAGHRGNLRTIQIQYTVIITGNVEAVITGLRGTYLSPQALPVIISPILWRFKLREDVHIIRRTGETRMKYQVIHRITGDVRPPLTQHARAVAREVGWRNGGGGCRGVRGGRSKRQSDGRCTAWCWRFGRSMGRQRRIGGSGKKGGHAQSQTRAAEFFNNAFAVRSEAHGRPPGIKKWCD